MSFSGSANYTEGLNAPEVDAKISDAISTDGALLKTANLSDLANVTTAKTNLSLQNVNNTSDANKPVSTAQATADALVASNAASDATTKANAAATASLPLHGKADTAGNADTSTTCPTGLSTGNNTGDQTISLTGDVTGSGTGSFAATIANLSVTAAKLAASAVTDAKLSLTTPALGAPTLSGKITNYNGVATVESGVPSSVVSVASTGNAANKGATTLLTPAGAGKYRMTVVTTVTTAASTTSSLPRTNMIYTDLNSVVKTIVIAPAFAGIPNLTTGIGATGTGLLNVKAGTAIQYSTGGTGGDYASTGGTAMRYDITVVLEAI